MICSMTGYGRGEVASGDSHFIIEVRSVNNRFIDIQVKAPRSFTALESRIKKTVQERCSRGRIDIFISRSGDREAAGRLTANEKLVSEYIEVMRNLQERFGLRGDVDLGQVAGFPGLISVTEDKEDIEAAWQALEAGLGQALDELGAMRAREGHAIVSDMTRRLDIIERLMAEVQFLSPASVEQARKRMSENLDRLLNEQPDPARLAQEIAILAERTDVTEELTRLNSHIGQYRVMISDSTVDPVGRKLDFLLQEMVREANTISSKAMNSQIAHHIVDIKAELEKIREQAQNIE